MADATPRLSKQLADAIEDFKALRPELATSDGARNQCIEASARFADLLLERGVISKPRGDLPPWEVMEIDVVNNVSHYAFRIGSTLIDWTARQFDASADWPKVWQDDELSV